MTARAHRTARPRPAVPREAGSRLPWWSLVLPAAAFAALLALTLSGGGTSSAGAAQPVARLLARIAGLLPG